MFVWLSVWVLFGKVQPFGQILSVAGFVLLAGLLEVVSLSIIVPAEARV